jgi:hypothetical protein
VQFNSAWRWYELKDEAFFDEISDEALEAAASGPGENITFTISINIFYCRFCWTAARLNDVTGAQAMTDGNYQELRQTRRSS